MGLNKNSFTQNINQLLAYESLPDDSESAVVAVLLVTFINMLYSDKTGIEKAFLVTPLFFIYLTLRKFIAFVYSWLIEENDKKTVGIFIGLFLLVPVDYLTGVAVNILLDFYWTGLQSL